MSLFGQRIRAQTRNWKAKVKGACSSKAADFHSKWLWEMTFYRADEPRVDEIIGSGGLNARDGRGTKGLLIVIYPWLEM